MDVEGEKNEAGRSGTVGRLEDDVGKLAGEAVVGIDGAEVAAVVVVAVVGNEELVIDCDELTTSTPPFLSQGFGGETIAGDQSFFSGG